MAASCDSISFVNKMAASCDKISFLIDTPFFGCLVNLRNYSNGNTVARHATPYLSSPRLSQTLHQSGAPV